VPGKRSKDQKLIAFPLDEHLLAQVDVARRGKSRSQYIREALAHYLLDDASMIVSETHISAPDRAGKGGRHRRPINYKEELKAEKANKRLEINSSPKKRQ
jgi:hypothetical protein